jgi:mRNA interferase MazF
MEEYRFGDIVIVNFPFTDGELSKPRPALVLSFDANRDVLLARITSKPYFEPGDFQLVGWQNLGLMFPSTLRASKLTTLKSSRIKQVIGRLSLEEKKAAVKALHAFVDFIAA